MFWPEVLPVLPSGDLATLAPAVRSANPLGWLPWWRDGCDAVLDLDAV
jgi:hypothetical protein